MAKKIILMLFVLSLVNIPAMASELKSETPKIEENTIDLNLEDMIKNIKSAPGLVEFDVPSEPLIKLENTEKAVEERVQKQLQKIKEVKESAQEQPQEKAQ